MFARLLRDNPLGLLLLCASLVGTGYLITYRLTLMEANNAKVNEKLDQISNNMNDFERSVISNIADLRLDVQTNVFELNGKFTDNLHNTEARLNKDIANINTSIALLQQGEANASN